MHEKYVYSPNLIKLPSRKPIFSWIYFYKTYVYLHYAFGHIDMYSVLRQLWSCLHGDKGRR